MASKVIEGYKKPLFAKIFFAHAHSFMNRFWFVWICMNANIKKMEISYQFKCDFKGHFYVLERFVIL